MSDMTKTHHIITHHTNIYSRWDHGTTPPHLVAKFDILDSWDPRGPVIFSVCALKTNLVFPRDFLLVPFLNEQNNIMNPMETTWSVGRGVGAHHSKVLSQKKHQRTQKTGGCVLFCMYASACI